MKIISEFKTKAIRLFYYAIILNRRNCFPRNNLKISKILGLFHFKKVDDV